MDVVPDDELGVPGGHGPLVHDGGVAVAGPRVGRHGVQLTPAQRQAVLKQTQLGSRRVSLKLAKYGVYSGIYIIYVVVVSVANRDSKKQLSFPSWQMRDKEE